MNTKEVIALLVFMVVIIGAAFVGMAYEDKLKHECRMEALKALVDPQTISRICG
jgi:hypothetical protein